MDSIIPARFKCPSSSDSDDSDDNESNFDNHKTKNNYLDDDDTSIIKIQNPNNIYPLSKPSNKLNILDNDRNEKKINNKFSIWSDILLEEQLTEAIDSSMKINQQQRLKKQRNGMRKKKKQKLDSEKDSENYFTWTQKDFDRKFSKKNHNDVDRKNNKMKRKNGIVMEIAHKLKEPRVDLIKKVVEVLGEEKSKRLAAEVQDIEDAGGIMTSNNNRRRSPGGVFFYLIKNDLAIENDQRKAIFCDEEIKQKTKKVKNLKKQKRSLSMINRDLKKKKKKNKKKRSKSKKH